MAVRKTLKRITIFAGVLLLLLLAAILTYRWWLPKVAGPIASRFGVEFKKIESLPDGRFVITDIEKSTENFDLTISRLEGFFPDAWYQRIKGETGTKMGVDRPERHANTRINAPSSAKRGRVTHPDRTVTRHACPCRLPMPFRP